MQRPGRLFAALALALAAAGALAAEDCRVAFDLGSSGIRAGASNSEATARIDLDYLGPLLAGRSLDDTEDRTAAALRDLPRQAGFDAACASAAGGFSAWRLALERDPGRLADLLARIQRESGVAIVVVPQGREGSYAHTGARLALGARLRTSHVLDIGGGSLQIADAAHAVGLPLGQKAWHHALCRLLRDSDALPCALQPLSDRELTRARALAQAQLSTIDTALSRPVTMTAVSRPVSRGVLPAVNRLAGNEDARSFRRTELAQAIERLAGRSVGQTADDIGSKPAYAAFLLSDMLLVEGLLRVTGSDMLQVAEADLTNLPGLLADDRLFDWASQHYPCYLDRLRTQGLSAYVSNPATCH
jgi:hypothetical protein